MLSLGFLTLGQSNGRATRAPFRIAIPTFRMPAQPVPAPKETLSREEITAAFADVVGPDANWTLRERAEQAGAARLRATLYS